MIVEIKKALQLFWMGMILAVFLSLFVIFLNNIITPSLINVLRQKGIIDTKDLIDALLYVYLFCSITLCFILYMLAVDNERFKAFYKRYLSRLITVNYYEDVKRTDLKGVYQANMAGSSRTLDADQIRKDIFASSKDGIDYEEVLIERQDIEDKSDGQHFLNYTGGQIAKEVNYRNGKLEGVYRVYYKDGGLHQEKHYKTGLLHGIFTAYDRHGTPYFEIYYKDGIQDGPDKTFYENGSLEYLNTYRNGVCVNRKTFSESGELVFDQDLEAVPSNRPLKK
ncbi:MAG: hypothetical protein Q8Q08_10145 [Candidatus Omnitrophota bacterium]|nr:hypothetical protein [Candidatus Omnitrophota bacterium]